MEKRQLIERALGRFRIEVEDAGAPYFALDYDALAEELVIECEVEHWAYHLTTKDGASKLVEHGSIEFARDEWDNEEKFWGFNGHRGTEGRAIAIVLSLEPKEATSVSD